MDTTNEVWKDIPEFAESYEVSNFGRVRSKNRMVRHNCGGEKKVKEKILSQLILPNGYCQVFLWCEGKRKACLVHRLVLLAFVGKCPEGQEVRHLNSVKTDNRLVNLAYGTHSENVIDTINLGRNSRQKLNSELALEIRRRANNGESVKALSAEFKVSTRAISKIKNNHTYSWL